MTEFLIGAALLVGVCVVFVWILLAVGEDVREYPGEGERRGYPGDER